MYTKASHNIYTNIYMYMLLPPAPHTFSAEHLHRAPATAAYTTTTYVVDDAPKLYQTSISPLSVRTSMTAWPKKSSLSLVKRLRSFARKSLSSSLEPANQRARERTSQ